LGDFYGWLIKRNIKVSYTGIDASTLMIKTAKSKYSNGDFRIESIIDFKKRANTYDYVFASGIFNRKIPHHMHFVKDAIKKMFSLSRRGMAFNIMSKKADYLENGEYYADAGEMLNFCMQLSRKIVFRHDYMPHDFSIYIYKEDYR
jgi:hypothetical protein